MTNPFEVRDTVTLLQAMEQIKPPATYLVDTFFSQKMPIANTSFVAVEYRKGKRLLAPYIVRGSKGVNVEREEISAKMYQAPMAGARRVFTISDLEKRQFGEQPIYSPLSPQERAAAMQARDLVDLQGMIRNRQNQQAAEILSTGKTIIKGYADDGKTFIEDEINYNFTNTITPSTVWSSAAANIYDDIQQGIERIAEDTGKLPTMLLCGSGIEKCLLNNKELKEWLGVVNRQNWMLGAVQPKYLAPQTRYIGTISALGIEIYSYYETYVDDSGQVKPFIAPNQAILITPGMGKQIFGAVSLIEKNSGVQTYAAEMVPHYVDDEINQEMSLAVYSRFIMVPDDIQSWVVFNAF